MDHGVQREIPRENITYQYESDGEEGHKTFYVVASCDEFSENKRLDFDSASHAKTACKFLQGGEWSMTDAQNYASSGGYQHKWL